MSANDVEPTPLGGGGGDQAGSAQVDVVIVSYNQRERLLECLESVRSVTERTHLIVVDNASSDGSIDAARRCVPEAELLALDTNLGFAAGVNRGVARGDAPYILLLNNDARLQPGAIDKLRAGLDQDRVAAAGPQLLGSEGQVELSLGRTLSPWNEAKFRLVEALYRDGRGPLSGAVKRHYERSRETRSLSGACILLRREAFEQVGGFDERFFLYAEDIDLCRRLRRAGYRLWYVADALVNHARGASSAVDPTASTLAYRRSQLAFYRKHHGALAANGLRLYLAVRFALKQAFSRGEQRELAATLLRWTLRESGS